MLHICLVTFILFISFTKVHLFIYVPNPTHSFPSHSFYRSQSISFTFTISGFTHTASNFNLIVSFIFLTNPVSGNQECLQINFNPKYILHHLKLNSASIATPCYFIRNLTCGSGFESSCSHLNFRFRACFEQGVP